MATKKKFLAKHGLAVNTSSGSTTTLNYPTADGAANQFIKTDGSGALSFASVADNFLALSDTPASFSGNNGKGILVKADGTGLEFGGGTVVNSVNRHELSGNGSTAFTLGTTYSSGNHIFVFVDGVIQNTPANYSLSGTTLTFTAAPENGADILVMGFLPSAGIIDVGDLIPDVDSSRDLGSTSKMFNNLFVNKIAADSDVTIAGTLNGHSVPAGSPGGKFLLATEVTTIGNGAASGSGTLAATASASGVTLQYSPPTPAGIGALATNGDGANLTNLSASALATGTVAMARISASALTAHINATVAPAFSNITSTPTTISGYGITDAISNSSPQLAGNLDVNGNNIVSLSNGNIVIQPNGSGQAKITNLQYDEDIHDLGTTGGTIAPDVSNGNVQTIALNNNLTLNAFSNPIAGQSLTLIINTSGTGRTLSSTMKFAGGSKTLSTTSTIDVITVFYDGTNYLANLVKNYS